MPEQSSSVEGKGEGTKARTVLKEKTNPFYLNTVHQRRGKREMKADSRVLSLEMREYPISSPPREREMSRRVQFESKIIFSFLKI